jgi:subtilisin family serine protease
VKDEIVIGVRRTFPDPDGYALEVASQTGGVVIGVVPETRTYQARYGDIPGPGLRRERIAELVSQYPYLIFASRDFLSRAISWIPDDAKYFHWEAVAAGNNWNLEIIRAPEAWDRTTGDAHTKVAVIDGGFDPRHQDLITNVVGPHGARGQRSGSTIVSGDQLWDGHGTHVAGTICASGNNRVGVSGVAWDCGLILSELETGQLAGNKSLYASPVFAQQRMVQAAVAGARIVNMSLQWIDSNSWVNRVSGERLPRIDDLRATTLRE